MRRVLMNVTPTEAAFIQAEADACQTGPGQHDTYRFTAFMEEKFGVLPQEPGVAIRLVVRHATAMIPCLGIPRLELELREEPER